jgi:hypothetical protein
VTGVKEERNIVSRSEKLGSYDSGSGSSRFGRSPGSILSIHNNELCGTKESGEKDVVLCTRIDIPWYLGYIENGKADESHTIDRKRIPLPGCLVVCASGRANRFVRQSR